MFAPEEQQLEICLLKSSLAEIENDLVLQRSALPALDVEREQLYHETMNALRIARNINVELERLKQENVRLIAKRMQLKRQCEDASKALGNAWENQNNLLKELNLVEKEEEEQIRKYEDNLREKAERFRNARVYFMEEEMNIEIQNLASSNFDLFSLLRARKATANVLYNQLYLLKAEVPDNMMAILGKDYLNDIKRKLTNQCWRLEDRLLDITTQRLKKLKLNKQMTRSKINKNVFVALKSYR